MTRERRIGKCVKEFYKQNSQMSIAVRKKKL
jgi:hypothetical protein